MTDGWYLVKGNTQYGPFTHAQLVECVATRKISRTDLVRREGSTAWRPAGLCPELFFDAPQPVASPFGVREPKPSLRVPFGTRVVAKMIDDFGYFLIFMTLFGFLLTALEGNGEVDDRLVWMILGLGVIGHWLYNALMLASRHQATLGKQWTGIKVTDREGNRLAFEWATARYLAEWLSRILLIGYFMAAFNKNQEALHDMMVGTQVVRIPKEYELP